MRVAYPTVGLRRTGFTLIEIMVTLVLVAVLSGIAYRGYADYRNRAEAARIAADLTTVRTAAIAYAVDKKAWPPSAPDGTVPPELQPYLPGNFTFSRPGYTLSWVYLPPADADTTNDAPTPLFAGVTVRGQSEQQTGLVTGLIGPSGDAASDGQQVAWAVSGRPSALFIHMGTRGGTQATGDPAASASPPAPAR